jgi:sugar/nucleoside kinase (ribokinase family)
MPKLGVVGSLVWDLIHGRDPAAPPVEEWGGIAYALAGLDASLPDDWEIVPLVKVGRDLAAPAQEFLRSLRHVPAGARFIEVPAPNNRVVLHYESAERRCERMSGGVPSWNWAELGPMVQDLDALYVNFISGFEMCLGTAQALRHGFAGQIYADFHSLFLGMRPDGIRVLRPLPDAAAWFGCFDAVQLNEDEMRQLSPDPLTLAAGALAQGVQLLVVTLGPRGSAYVAAPGFDGWQEPAARAAAPPSAPIRSALVSAPAVDAVDPTGCGDVFGAALFSRLLSAERLEPALRGANAVAARNAGFRGTSGLVAHLRGELLVSTSGGQL